MKTINKKSKKKEKNKKIIINNYKIENSDSEKMNENENEEDIRDLEKLIDYIILNEDEIKNNINISIEKNILEDETLKEIKDDYFGIKHIQDNLSYKGHQINPTFNEYENIDSTLNSKINLFFN